MEDLLYDKKKESAEIENAYTEAEVLVSPTWTCNLKCKYCFIRRNHVIKVEPPMSNALAERMLDALDEGFPDAQRIRIHFYGGEPFMNVNAIKTAVFKAVKEKPGRFLFAVTTNGTQCTDEVMEILDAGNFYVVLSIDGPEEIHDECRITANGSKSHATVRKFLDMVLSKTSCHVMGSSVVRSGWRLREAVKYLRSLPVHTIKAQMVRIPTGSPYALTPSERQEYLDDLDVLGKWVIEEIEEGKIPRDSRFSSKTLQLLRGSESRFAFCGAGRNCFGITPEGNMYPCLLIDEPGSYLGNIADDPKVWREKGHQWRIRPKREKCLSCPSFQLCGGGCPAIISVCGDEECDVITKNCEVAHNIYSHFQDRPEMLLALAGIV